MSTHHELYLGIERLIDFFLIESNALAALVTNNVNEINTVRYMVDDKYELQVSRIGSTTNVTYRGAVYQIFPDQIRLCTKELKNKHGEWVMGNKTNIEMGNEIMFSPGTEIVCFKILDQFTLRIAFLKGDNSMQVIAYWNGNSTFKFDHDEYAKTHTVCRT